MFSFVRQLFKGKDLRNKVLIVAALLIVTRLFASIPIPGADQEKLRLFFAQNQFLGLVNLFSGGALSNFSIAMLGVGPYITATIILQLLTMVFPSIKTMYYEEGEQGRQKFNQYARLMTAALAAIQGFSFLSYLKTQGVVVSLSPFDLVVNIFLITAGSMFLMWLGELITEQKIGEGVSLIIFSGIIAGLPTSLRTNILTFDPSQIPSYVIFIALALVTIVGVVLINDAERKIPVNYAKRVRGMKMYGGANTYLPIRVNQAGVIPIIFAISILLFPGMIAQVLALTKNPAVLRFAVQTQALLNNQAVYGISYFVLVFIFTYFYTMITFEPNEISKNLQKQGGFIPGIRPGHNTASYLSQVLNRITFPGAIFLGVIAVLPLIVQAITGVASLRLGGTSLLIVVSVALDTIRQIRAQLLMREYDTF
ncbi:MAG: preprotein translocase subunit SecY [Candidatus Brennerbacteria bacterium CG11_big_fil_rev_8_21_14_0_20_43_10]|uniref:Protein translocase subunit SecY n=3 Tax=Candidatus Brenneribacteriota TaxID=1817902 RepID=A0A2M8C359_9BACT|nr:MAG: preprotein translocase subunit SecY [Parcubacteria group bacterium CG1_02_44_31]PIP50452.1 MAG: preprotein translocase subunit SecY [Candidatus Brennerbacteria bacterium CG23_combo_of_CG06-09_8_20_14_all_44_41]PIR26171.1 MAG: preprotein translocase subunit SecY [Candidatus Brennerbacteria bacterium CG11_big_fil_rev_8_21_14_0_20_43_10]PIX28742.1 MAG: preprotein translocase subunit SecY [Candidatus Brennerbacteria bacterium CG_4_8_14_3_um_filter_43_14]PJB50531.1 MAG: preprotein translocas